MAANPLPTDLDALLTLGEDAADGAAAHAATIGLLQNTEARIRADIATLRTAKLNSETAKAAKVVATAAQTVADSNGKAAIGAASSVLAVRYGSTWSTAWEPTGFPNNSIGVPRLIVERMNLLQSLHDYFAANPTHENAPLNVTATQFATLFTALSNARSAVHAAITAAATALAARRNAETGLRRRLRGTIDELAQLLDDTDPRWYAFGLVPPALEDTPEQPTGLVLNPQPDGTILADWADASRATGYRVEILIVGVDAAFHLFASVTDSDATLSGVPAGATVQVRVIAVNAAGDTSPPSDVVEVLVPGTPVQPVTLSWVWNPTLMAASFNWNASTNPNLSQYQLR
jgi:hypothetical protein